MTHILGTGVFCFKMNTYKTSPTNKYRYRDCLVPQPPRDLYRMDMEITVTFRGRVI